MAEGFSGGGAALRVARRSTCPQPATALRSPRRNMSRGYTAKRPPSAPPETGPNVRFRPLADIEIRTGFPSEANIEAHADARADLVRVVRDAVLAERLELPIALAEDVAHL